MEPRPQNVPIANAFATKADLDLVIHSKDHFVQLFAVRGGFLLPPRSYITWDFIRSILKGTKRLLYVHQVPALYKPPKVSELTVARLYEQIKGDERVTVYLPDTHKVHDKLYFFSVLAAVIPNFYAQVLQTVQDNRKKEITEDEKVEICPEMKALIEQGVPYFGPREKVGHYVNQGRRWGNPGPRQAKDLDIRQIF